MSSHHPSSSAPLRIGVAGLGTVGSAVIRLLHFQAQALRHRTGREIIVTSLSARDPRKDRGLPLQTHTWFEDPVEMASSPSIDVFVELMGGEDGMALDSVRTALESGKSVVTANKALLAKHGQLLAKLAEENNVALAFEASVAGGIPIVKTLREGLAGNSIERIYGILNGTCNYILSQMELEGLSFETCLARAQQLGYAEADPTFDIGGYDTAHKLAILTSLAFGTMIDINAVSVEGIESISLTDILFAKELGYRIKLLGVAQKTAHGIEQRVHPTMIPLSSNLAQTMGVMNAVTIDADAVHELTLVGPGAGGNATASAVVADIADIAKGVRSPPFGIPLKALQTVPLVPMQRHEGGYYIRFSVQNRPGAIAAIATRLAECAISIESVMQRPRLERIQATPDACVPVVFITSATTEAFIKKSLAEIERDGFTEGRAQVMRIERE